MKIVFNDTKKEDHLYLTKLIYIYFKEIVDYSKVYNNPNIYNIYTDDIPYWVDPRDTNKDTMIYNLLKYHLTNITSYDNSDELDDIVYTLINKINLYHSFIDAYKNKIQSLYALAMLKNDVYKRKDISLININGLILNCDDDLIDISRDIYTICSPSTKSYDIEFLDKDYNIITSDTQVLEALLAIILLTTRRYKKRMIKKSKKILNKFKKFKLNNSEV